MNIKQFIAKANEYLEDKKVNTIKELLSITDPKEYKDGTFDELEHIDEYDIGLEADFFSNNENAIKQLAEYFKELNLFIATNIFSDEETDDIYGPTLDDNQFCTGILFSDDHQINNLYKFLNFTNDKIRNICVENNAEIRLHLYQMDEYCVGDNSSVIYNDIGNSKNISFKFEYNNPFDIYVTACTLNEICDTQEELDEIVKRTFGSIIVEEEMTIEGIEHCAFSHTDYSPIPIDKLCEMASNRPVKFTREILDSMASDTSILDMSPEERAKYLNIDISKLKDK